MATKTRASKRSTNKAEQKAKDIHDGKNHAYQWLTTHHPSQSRQVFNCRRRGSHARPWECVYAFDPRMAEILKARGTTYARAFLDAIVEQWGLLDRPWAHLLYKEGVAHGSNWARTMATPDQIECLRKAATEIDSWSIFSPFVQSIDSYSGGSVTPAHDIVMLLLGEAYPGSGEHEEYELECEEFRNFWQPFLDEPIDRFFHLLRSDPRKQRHKLQEPDYVLGFIDGAIGLSTRLQSALPLFSPLVFWQSADESGDSTSDDA